MATISDLGVGRREARQQRLMDSRGFSSGQARRASRLYDRSVRDWRRGGREGARPTMRGAADFTASLRGIDEQADRRDLRKAYRTGGYGTFSGDLTGLLEEYRAGLPTERGDVGPEEVKSMWRRDAEPGTYSPLYDAGNLNDLVDRDRWLATIGAPHSLPQNWYTPPGAYGGFSPDDLPSKLEWYLMVNGEDPRFRPGGRFG